MTSLALRGGSVVDQLGRRRADVVIDGARIVAVEADASGGDRELDASGCLVTPGLVDIHVHFRTPGDTASEDLVTGARAAALGGVTAVVMMPNTEPCLDDVDSVRGVLADARGLPCELHAAAAITRGRAGERLVDLVALHAAGVRLFTDDGSCVGDAALMRAALESARALPGAVIAQHAEDPALVAGGVLNEGAVAERLGVGGRPVEAEEIVVARDLVLARLTGARYHVLHVSGAPTAALLRAAKASGLQVTAEVTPQHLVLTEGDIEALGTSGKMNPPLRGPVDVAALRLAVAEGTIDAIATDHAPHAPLRKALPLAEAPPGMLGVETGVAVTFTELVHGGLLRPEQAIGLHSWRPAQVASIRDHGRPVAPGEPANLAVIDPEATWTVAAGQLASKSVNTPWDGRRLRGRVRHTVLRGQPVVVDAQLR